ncbi:hypothetical protein LSTR_LSTR001892 [Laodelphax striatellus]|uniref:Uncharacterized protein n=1 Tax=Laodelphax striatellus TaxID=195883 RepID=A0A482WG34_LAOST|nr:hypothetical protein LSTR_LSTR001892 [Laodelphax striatellus]
MNGLGAEKLCTMDDELSAIAEEIESFEDGLTSDNEIDGDIGKYMTFSEEETDVKVEIKNDDVLSSAIEDGSERLDFEGFECSFDPNAFETVEEEANDETQEKIARNDDKEEELISDFDNASTSEQPESQKGLDDINDCFESPFDNGCLNNSESVETRRKSTKDSDEKEEELPLKRTWRKVVIR